MTPITSMVCYYSAVAGDCVVLKDAAGATVKVRRLPMNYADFARRVMRSKAWSLSSYGFGSFHFARKP